MTWKNFVSRKAVSARRRGLATATLYGLSLAVRFTSATGEEVEIPAHAVQTKHALIMTTDGSGLPYQDWGLKIAQPIVFRRGWPPSPPPRCITP
ncbi:MAG: hypothetical protein GY844_30855 [Bradyrhizobium sp.]|nr:hypothetical protein [Bradyrhizobium sp.]